MEVVTTARNSVASRLASGRALMRSDGEGGSRLPAVAWRSVDIVTDALARAGSGGGLIWRSFLAVVVLPTVIFWLYSALWQSNRYVSETRLTVRQAQQEKKSGSDAASIMAKMTGGGSGGGGGGSQDSYMVLNYVKSRAILVDLGGREYMEGKFSGPGVDYFSRLSKGSTIEELWKYWLGHVAASVDTLSGILTVRVDAFRPQDAMDIAQDIVRESENLVNKITLRNRRDAVKRAELEVNLTRHMLADAKEKTLRFRNENFLIDPGSRAVSIGDQIGKLTLERIDLVNALSTFSSSLSEDAPSQRLQKARLAVIDQQIAELKKKLTSGPGADTVSSQIATYERLKLEEAFAEQQYTLSQNSYQKARQDLEKQQLYLVTVVTPTLPESALYPKVIGNTVMIFAGLLVAWSVVTLIAASINDQMT
ncbi:hypothetical protein [Methylocystis sp. ATCC 49242]|uniref:hypothetical protein n=1 Tax=Methylocystis sp. ATCC 49242 TaxID=622637 RepID=UPI0001F887FE|nr:hypothetical protein [Methylocystis sp. ATCC 49242]